jgi:ABC-type dipeptide/oligopeptide/nickel transport system permease subunit
MTSTPVTPAPTAVGKETDREFTVKARTQRQMVARRFFAHKLAVGSLIVFVLMLLAAFIVPFFWKYSYNTITNTLSAAPSWTHPFGTDSLGHDVFAEVLRGTQTSVKVSALAMIVGETTGVLIGAFSGYYLGKLDATLMRAVDVLLTLPLFVFIAVLQKITGGSWWIIALIIGGLGAGLTARLVRSVFLSLREREYVEAARALGATDKRIIMRHLLPNALGPIIVDATLTFALAIITEASLSFLGFGITPPDVSLGTLIQDGVAASQTRPWLFYFPGFVIILLVLTVNFIGDGLRDALDPTQQRVRA